MMAQRLSGKNIKLIALDMDGTLLNSKKQLTERTLRVIEEAYQAGIEIIPATGRPTSGLPKEILDSRGVNYALCSNGAAIVELREKRVLNYNSLSRETVLSTIEALKSFDLILDIFADGKITTEERNMHRLHEFLIPENMLPYIRGTRVTVDSIEKFVREEEMNIEKINLFFKDKVQREEVIKGLSLLKDIEITSSLNNNLEINSVRANKGQALQWIADYLHIPMEQVMACGDSSNDSTMLKLAGLSVAMGNGTEEIKVMADHITSTNDEDGVAEVIEQLL